VELTTRTTENSGTCAAATCSGAVVAYQQAADAIAAEGGVEVGARRRSGAPGCDRIVGASIELTLRGRR
jgi:hypothetical protein